MNDNQPSAMGAWSFTCDEIPGAGFEAFGRRMDGRLISTFGPTKPAALERCRGAVKFLLSEETSKLIAEQRDNDEA